MNVSEDMKLTKSDVVLDGTQYMLLFVWRLSSNVGEHWASKSVSKSGSFIAGRKCYQVARHVIRSQANFQICGVTAASMARMVGSICRSTWNHSEPRKKMEMSFSAYFFIGRTTEKCHGEFGQRSQWHLNWPMGRCSLSTVSILSQQEKKAVYFNRSQRMMIQHLSLSTLRGIDMRGSSVVAGSCGMRPGY
jgi:hypothetical protein